MFTSFKTLTLFFTGIYLVRRRCALIGCAAAATEIQIQKIAKPSQADVRTVFELLL